MAIIAGPQGKKSSCISNSNGYSQSRWPVREKRLIEEKPVRDECGSSSKSAWMMLCLRGKTDFREECSLEAEAASLSTFIVVLKIAE